jgi:hypothetical protein
MKISNDLSYLLGVFAGDGSLYYSGGSPRVEFCDGSSVENEIKYSEEFLHNIVTIIRQNFDIAPKIFRKGNQFIIKFRNKAFCEWLMNFGFRPGEKCRSADIPLKIRGSKYERNFWIGVMDTDGMIGRKTKNVTLWSASRKLCESFSKFLNTQSVVNSICGHEMRGTVYYCVKIKSAFVRDFSEKIGFHHPRKTLWLKRHIQKSFYVKNNELIGKFLLNDRKTIDYRKIFPRNIYIVGGARILNKNSEKNSNFQDTFDALVKKGMSRNSVCRIFDNFRWKASKGSTTSIKLPLFVSTELKDITNFIRIRSGGITISKQYIKSWNREPDEIIGTIESLFDIKPKHTCKGELIYDSTVLKEFFTRVTERET